MKTQNKDSIFSSPITDLKSFEFDSQVAEVFPDMIQRSVPGYNIIVDTIGQLTKRYAQENSICYDLGCSLGAISLAMRKVIDTPQCKIIAVDNSAPMIERCRLHMEAYNYPTPVEILCDDILNITIQRASVVALNFTLQFIDQTKRQQLINKIYADMLPGAILILSEKIIAQDEETNSLLINLHHDFKRTNGYSDLEISQKRSALENVLIAETKQQHHQRLQKAGFKHYQTWFQYFNFLSLIAIKGKN